jgi:hypothetical protein
VTIPCPGTFVGSQSELRGLLLRLLGRHAQRDPAVQRQGVQNDIVAAALLVGEGGAGVADALGNHAGDFLDVSVAADFGAVSVIIFSCVEWLHYEKQGKQIDANAAYSI